MKLARTYVKVNIKIGKFYNPLFRKKVIIKGIDPHFSLNTTHAKIINPSYLTNFWKNKHDKISQIIRGNRIYQHLSDVLLIVKIIQMKPLWCISMHNTHSRADLELSLKMTNDSDSFCLHSIGIM